MNGKKSTLCGWSRRVFLSLLLVPALVVQPAAAGPGNALHTDPPPPIALQTVTTPLNLIVDIQHAGDGRLFIVQQTGQIYVYDGISVLPTPFLDVHTLVSSGGEQGLLGLAFHPNYASNGFFYLNYINTSGNTQIARYHVSADPNVADAGSGTILLSITQPESNHNGGQIAFGADGYLYIGTGDGGGGGDLHGTIGNGQNLNTFLGKILRIDVDGGSPYAIPSGNPFVETPIDDPQTLGEIWAYGLRNPWRFSFDRLSHDMLIGDVGQNRREEVDFLPAASTGGENYGWRVMEGTECFNVADFNVPLGSCDSTNKVLPILEYSHASGNCSVTGGFRYRGRRYPALAGVYLYSDFCSGRIWGATPDASENWSSSELLDNPFNVTTFGEDLEGEVYTALYSSLGGPVYRIMKPGQRSPSADFNSDGKSDIGYFRASTGVWGILQSVQNYSYTFPHFFSWGQSGDLALPSDYDGDGKVDPAVRRPPAGGQSAAYAILPSSTGYSYSSALTVPAGWPGLGDTPVLGDYNGDGRADPGIWRSSTGAWIIPLSPSFSNYQFAAWGSAGDVPVSADVDGDGQTDIGYFRPSTGVWGFLLSGQAYSYGSPQFFSWGSSTDTLVMTDYDGDGMADPAFVTPPAGGQSAAYRILRSSTGFDFGQTWTIPAGWPGLGDMPVPADYDGDGKADAGIWRSSAGVWIIPKSSTNNSSYMFASWGVSGDQVIH